MESCDCRLSKWTGRIPETGGERDRERDKMLNLRVTYPQVDSALRPIQQLSTNPKSSSVLQDHANQKTASLRRPSVEMLTACERKKTKHPVRYSYTHTEIVCHCGNSAGENSSPFPSVRPTTTPSSLSLSLFLKESKLLYLSLPLNYYQICQLEHVNPI